MTLLKPMPALIAGPENLKALVKSKGIRLNKRRMARPKPVFPHNAARSYARFIRQLLTGFAAVVKRESNSLLLRAPPPAEPSGAGKHDADTYYYNPSEMSRLIQEMRNKLTHTWNMTASEQQLRETINAFAADFAAYNGEGWLKTLTGTLGVDVMLSEPWLKPHIDLFTSQNVALIRDIGERLTKDVSFMMIEGVRSGRRHEDIARDIANKMGVDTRRAKLIARDQTLKFNGSLSKIRQENLGIRRFVWRTVEDERVRGNPSGLYPNSRPSHYAVDGKVFSWDQPPKETGHFPGQAILCRCWAEPLLSDLLDDE